MTAQLLLADSVGEAGGVEGAFGGGGDVIDRGELDGDRRPGAGSQNEDIPQDVIARNIAAGALERVDNPIAWLDRSASDAMIDDHRTRRQHVPINDSVRVRCAHRVDHYPRRQT